MIDIKQNYILPKEERNSLQKKIRSNYREYLSGEHWKELKQRYLRSGYPRKCYCCGSRKDLALHHVTYKRVGFEKLSDLKMVCERCHESIHVRVKSIIGLSGKHNINKILWKVTKKRRKYLKKRSKYRHRAKKMFEADTSILENRCSKKMQNEMDTRYEHLRATN